MPRFSNPAMRKLMPEGGRQITFYTDTKLEEWLSKIPQVQYPGRPKQVTDKDCYSLLVLLWYTGARPTELAHFKKHQIYPLYDGKEHYGFSISLITKKRRKEFYRKISIPYNQYTLQAYQNIQDSSPEGYYFHYFRASQRTSTRTINWTNTRTIYVRTPTGQLLPETQDRPGEGTYECFDKLIRTFSLALTGLPPLYFRHHRFSWMARLGASPNQIKEFKGAADIRSVEDYVQFSDQMAKENLAFFPKSDLQ